MSLESLRLLFWVVASALMAAAVVTTLKGVIFIRAGRLEAHRQAMSRAVLLVSAFLVAYAAKVVWLGHEPLSTWSVERLTTLQVHRSFVFSMLLAGALARALGPWAAAERDKAGVSRAHRWIGRVAAFTGAAGLLTALAVLVQMFAARGG